MDLDEAIRTHGEIVDDGEAQRPWLRIGTVSHPTVLGVHSGPEWRLAYLSDSETGETFARPRLEQGFESIGEPPISRLALLLSPPTLPLTKLRRLIHDRAAELGLELEPKLEDTLPWESLLLYCLSGPSLLLAIQALRWAQAFPDSEAIRAEVERLRSDPRYSATAEQTIAHWTGEGPPNNQRKRQKRNKRKRG